jgi:hypothetical protein
LVPARVRVVVPYFPSPESLSPSFGALHRGDLSASAAMRLSSSGPEGPSDSVRQAPLVSFCSARDPRATPWPFSPLARVELGRHKSSLQRPGASPRGRSPRPNPRPSRSCSVSSSSRDGPRFDLSRAPFCRCRASAKTGIVLVSNPTPEPPFSRSPEGDRRQRGGCLPPPPNPRAFHGPSDRSPSGSLRKRLGGKTPLVPLRMTGSV